MNYKEHRATMQHAARYVKQCENRLRYATLHKRGDAEQAMHADASSASHCGNRIK